jgi:hypothetical protein
MNQSMATQAPFGVKLTNSFPPAPKRSKALTPEANSVAEIIAPAMEKMANLNFIAAQTQNQAMQANSLATEQTLQGVKKTQFTILALTEENARLNEKIVALEHLIKRCDQAHQLQIQALINQNAAMQKHILNVEGQVVSVKDAHKTHIHVLERGTVTVKRTAYPKRRERRTPDDRPITTTETFENAPTKITEPPSHEKIPTDDNGCIVQ